MRKPTRWSLRTLFGVARSAVILFTIPTGALAAESSPPTRPTEGRPAPSVATEGDLAKVVERLEQPATRMLALSELTAFAGPKLYQTGSVIHMHPNRNIDALQQKAVAAIRRHADFATVSQALDSTDPRLQFWGVWFWRGSAIPSPDGKPNVWLTLMPKVKHLAVNGDASVRLNAVERLQGHAEARDFLRERIGVETSPGVLLRLAYFNGSGGSLSERFNPLLLRLLNHADRQVRLHALTFISFNHYHAPMWHIDFDQAIVAKVAEMTKAESESERQAAIYALDQMQKELVRH